MYAARGEIYGPEPKRRVLLASLFHQTNTFVGGRTGLEDFEIRRGEELRTPADDASPIAVVLEVGRERNWQIVPVVDMRALSGPTVADAVVDLFWAEFRAVADAAAADGVDGVFLILHGSMVSESLLDVEGEILRRMRGIEHLSTAPICGVFDLHANFTEAMARQCDGLIACREDLGTDVKEAATTAALLLDGLMQTEERPTTVREHPPVLWPPSGAATDEEPMLSLERRAREIEVESPEIVAVNALAGFPYADVPEAGVGFSAITTGDLESAHAGLRELNVLATSLREAGHQAGMPLEAAMARLREHEEGPVLLIEPSDAVVSGAPGDGTRLLQALVEYGVPDAGVVIDDAKTVSVLADARAGERREVAVGGKSGEAGAEPLSLEVELISRSDGLFAPGIGLPSSFSSIPDDEIDMGPCAVVRHGGVTVLLTSRRTPPVDLGQWRSQGIDPEDLFAIVVKAAVEHNTAYAPIARASYTVDVPGPCPQDLQRLPFERVSRPVHPLDDL